jgi:hypothetical protein
MMELLAALEHSGLARAIKGSFLIYPLINAAHILAIGVLVTSVSFLDLALLGLFRQAMSDPVLSLLRSAALSGFAAAAASGLLLFSIRATQYAEMPIFVAKMLLIALSALNFAVFSTLLARRGKVSIARKVSAALSILLWLSVLVCGRLIGFL